MGDVISYTFISIDSQVSHPGPEGPLVVKNVNRVELDILISISICPAEPWW